MTVEAPAAGRLVAAGNDGDGQVSGIVESAQGRRITAVAAGYYHSLAVTDDGTLLAAGDDEYGQVSGILKAAQGHRITTASASTWYNSLAVTDDGTLLAAGDDRYGQVSGIVVATRGHRTSTVAAGFFYSLAVVDDRGDCGPLKAHQICASFTKAQDPQDTYTLDFLITGTPEQDLTSGAPARAVDTVSPEPTHIVVRRVAPPGDVATGSVYFTHDPATGEITIDDASSELPEGLTYRRADGNRFAFTWNR
ncbi:hypothetical protein ACW14Y_04895 [Kitasatospora sp. cg17-2]